MGTIKDRKSKGLIEAEEIKNSWHEHTEELSKRKTLNITHYQRNAHQNHNEVPLHTSQDGCYPKAHKQ